MNNRRKKPFRILAAMLCIALVLCVCSGYQARAESTSDYPVVSNAIEFLQAFAEAKDGDTIGISSMIAFYEGSSEIGSEDKQINIVRMNEEAYFSFTGTGSFSIQNFIFDGNNIESMYSMIYSQRNLTLKNSTFQNCICNGEGAAVYNMERTDFYNCTFKNNSSTGRGGHVSMYEGIFENCVLIDGTSNFEGGAVACGAVDFNNCLITGNHAGMYGGGIYTSGITVLTGTKLYNNTAGACGPDYVDSQNGVHISESIEELAALYKSDGLKPINWETTTVGFMIGGKLILEEFVEKPEPEQPTNPEEPETPIEPENPDQPDTPTEPETPDQPDKPTEPGENEPPKDEPGSETEPPAEGEEKPSEPGTSDKEDESEPTEKPEDNPNSDNPPSSPSDSTEKDNGGNSTSTTTTTTNTTDSRTTDSSDNSRYSNTSDSNNTSTVNNYYQNQPEQQPSNGGEAVQTIVVPVGNAENGEPIEQTIRIEGNQPEGSNSGSAEGTTLNINVNVGTDQAGTQAATSPDASNNFSLYQVLVLCLLSGIFVCLIRKR